MLKELTRNEEGFTLVELIVVIAIMAVLAALLIPRIMGNVADATRQTEITTAQTLASEITIYNAKKIAANKPTEAVQETTKLTADKLPTDLKLPTGTSFPKDSIVKIVVDKSGNASIEIVGATPTP